MQTPPPQGARPGPHKNWPSDLLAGFQVFLIALPLSLGIAMASGFPPIAGLTASIIGGLLVSLFGGGHVTINGPAAGLIVIVLGGVHSLGGGDAVNGYRYTLAAIVCAGILQMLLSQLKADRLSAYFPAPAVHGMLAAIGVMIVSKQLHTVFGQTPHGHEALEVLASLPHSIWHANPSISIIGLGCLLIAFGWPLLPKNLSRLPAPVVILLFGMGLGHLFGLQSEHTYTFAGNTYAVGPHYLISLPDKLTEAIVLPSFKALDQWLFWKLVLTISIIASLESLLSALAVDKLDPLQRQTNLKRDLGAVGLATTISGLLGGLPLITEIVRSSANIQQGARTRWANFFHAVVMLAFVLLLPGLLKQIPLAALAALLVYTGVGLAAPQVFRHIYSIGTEQLLIFMTTLLCTLASDLLIGIGCGILVKLLIHRWRGVSWRELFVLRYQVSQQTEAYEISLYSPALFSNLIQLQQLLQRLPAGHQIALNLSHSCLIDHSTLTYLQQFGRNYLQGGGQFRMIGLEAYHSLSSHPLAARMNPGSLTVKPVQSRDMLS